jgi:hypothetical protein
MSTSGWDPDPIDTGSVSLPDELVDLIELLAQNAHDNWGRQRIDDGWRYGPVRDDAALTHPLLVPYPELPDSEKEYDRRLATETLKVIATLGYRIVPAATADEPSPASRGAGPPPG